MDRSLRRIRLFSAAPGVLIAVIGLSLVSRSNYLLFYTLVEIFSIVVAFSIFLFVWNARSYFANDYFVFVAIGYLFMAGIDVLHTLAYKGMGTFGFPTTNLSTQLWIAGRAFQSVSLFAAPMFLRRKLNVNLAVFAFAASATLVIGLIFEWDTFPVAFREDTGLTAFKRASEYSFALLMLASSLLVVHLRNLYERDVLQLLIASILATTLAELTFTLYRSPYDIFNLLGHLLRFVSFYLMLRAVIETGFLRPYSLLFRDLKEREQTLQRRSLELEERNEDLDAFAHTVAHELGEPLAAISVAATALQSPALPQRDRRDYVDGIVSMARKMGHIIDDLLTLAMVRKAQVVLEPVDMGTIIATALERSDQMIEARQAVILKPKEWPAAMGNPAWVEEVWANLISNALKYGGSPPRLEMGAGGMAPDCSVRFWLHDNGPGLDPDAQSRLFRPITWAGHRQSLGHGLGLAICRQIVEKMGGTIGVESQVGYGSLFYFTLPSADDPPLDPQRETGGRPQGQLPLIRRSRPEPRPLPAAG